MSMRQLSLCWLDDDGDRLSLFTELVERDRERAALTPRARSGTSLLCWRWRVGMRRGEGEAEIKLPASTSNAWLAFDVSMRRDVCSET